MTVYVESNFVLEVALGQEQAEAAESLLTLAERHAIELALPAFALSEPFATVAHRGRERTRLVGHVRNQVRELARSRPHKQEVSALAPAAEILTRIERREWDLLTSTTERLLRFATIIQIDLAVFQDAMAYRTRFDLSHQDSIVYAAVVNHLRQNPTSGPHYFVSKNWKDFGDPDIRQELAAHGCVFIESFDRARELIVDS